MLRSNAEKLTANVVSSHFPAHITTVFHTENQRHCIAPLKKMQRYRAVTPSLMRSSPPSTSPLPVRLNRRHSSMDHFEDAQRSWNHHERKPIVAIPCAKLFLGDLSFHCSEKEIEDEFLAKGYDAEVKISSDIHGKTRGYGFAELKSMELATQARDELQGMRLHGRTIRINYAGRLIQDQTPLNTLTSPINSVYVRFRTDLDVTFDEAYLESFFMSYGAISDVCIKDVCKVGKTLDVLMFDYEDGLTFQFLPTFFIGKTSFETIGFARVCTPRRFWFHSF